jgi:hypothetical protein
MAVCAVVQRSTRVTISASIIVGPMRINVEAHVDKRPLLADRKSPSARALALKQRKKVV